MERRPRKRFAAAVLNFKWRTILTHCPFKQIQKVFKASYIFNCALKLFRPFRPLFTTFPAACRPHFSRRQIILNHCPFKHILAIFEEIILAKVSRLCQLSSYSCGFLSRLQIFKAIDPSLWNSVVHKTPTYDTKMLLKDFFDKTALVEFRICNIQKILMKHIQNNQKSIGKSHTSNRILKIARKKSAN